jgi:signal transduction histidine kinase
LFTGGLLAKKVKNLRKNQQFVPYSMPPARKRQEIPAVKELVFRAGSTAEQASRELRAARDVAQAFLTANSPSEVYHLALERVTPLVGAAFGSVFLRDDAGDGDLLRVVAAYNWPAAYRAYLDELRVRVGLGPTGLAVAENRVVEVDDVFADPSWQDWWEAARELGFASSTSLPLMLGGAPAGAVTFYFREPGTLDEADRSLLRLVADQLAAVAEKAHLIDDLQRANTQLREQNVELEVRYREAEEARRLKSEFLANVSHELRTPLTAILGYTYLLREGLTGELGPDQVASVEKIDGAATDLLRLINDLLDLTDLKLGRTSFEFQTCDAVALTRSALSHLPTRDGVEVRSELPATPLPVHTDPVHLLRILGNLLSNALKFTERGTVTVRLYGSGGMPGADPERSESTPVPQVAWEVEDTGIGIAEAAQKHIFDEFRQADGSATRRYGGTGLGLSLSRGLTLQLGGDLTVRSRLGEGSTFRLRLPATRAGVSGSVTDALKPYLAHDDTQ